MFLRANRRIANRTVGNISVFLINTNLNEL